MNLRPLGANLTLIVDSDGNEYLFSYETLVAGYDVDSVSEATNGYWYVNQSYSRTTTRHIKKYLENLYHSERTGKMSKAAALEKEVGLM